MRHGVTLPRSFGAPKHFMKRRDKNLEWVERTGAAKLPPGSSTILRLCSGHLISSPADLKRRRCDRLIGAGRGPRIRRTRVRRLSRPRPRRRTSTAWSSDASTGPVQPDPVLLRHKGRSQIKVLYWRQRDPSRHSFLSSIKGLVSAVSATVASEFFSGLLRQGISQADTWALSTVLLDENDAGAF